MAENAILQELDHPFIVGMKYAFQDRDNLYVIMRNFSGGDFRFHLFRNRVFTEAQTRLFAGCIVLALEYIHSRNIIHRDIKPENLVFDENGYLYLTDFGVAKYWRADNSENTSGTPGYMAPEVLCHQNHSFSVDYYALGIMVVECMTGRRPHNGKSRKEIKEQIMAKQAVVKENMVIGEWSSEALDFCNRLIQRKREKRLGEEGISELKLHPWFRNFDWNALSAQTVRASYTPNLSEATFDRKNALKEDDPFNEEDLKQLRRKTIQNSFKGYEFNFLRTVRIAVQKDREKSIVISQEKMAIQSTASS